MKKFFVLVLFMIALFPSIIVSQDDTAMDEESKAWMEYMTPGPMHEMLAKDVGEWKTTSKMWNKPGDAPMESEGSIKTESIMGGRYFQTKYTSTMMGMPVEGLSTEAFDNGKQEFINTWIDNLGTGMAISYGKYDEMTKTINYKGTMFNPVTGKDMEFRSVLKMIDDNNKVFEIWSDYEGKEFKMMEMTYTR